MNDKLIKAAIAEAERFLKVAKLAGTEEVTDYHEESTGWKYGKRKGTTNRTNAALKRASLDLSNALADMRRR